MVAATAAVASRGICIEPAQSAGELTRQARLPARSASRAGNRWRAGRNGEGKVDAIGINLSTQVTTRFLQAFARLVQAKPEPARSPAGKGLKQLGRWDPQLTLQPWAKKAHLGGRRLERAGFNGLQVEHRFFSAGGAPIGRQVGEQVVERAGQQGRCNPCLLYTSPSPRD